MKLFVNSIHDASEDAKIVHPIVNTQVLPIDVRCVITCQE